MLLLHQTGSVCVGEVSRYTVTYTPGLDRILPPPSQLHVKIKNTSAIPLRAAYLHGPYTLYTACYPSTFDPNKKHTTSKDEGDPDYEPQLKAGGQWSSKLTIPKSVTDDAGLTDRKEGEPRKSFTWIIEIASQVLFSTTASVHYELLVGRDEKSVSLGFTGTTHASGVPGRLEDHRLGATKAGQHMKGVFTKAITLKVDDTDSLWDSPILPSRDQVNKSTTQPPRLDKKDDDYEQDRPKKRRKRIHLVVLTHGLHSNLGADMLFMKESIEATARQAKEDAKNAKRAARELQATQKQDFRRQAVDQRSKSAPELLVSPTPAMDGDDNKAKGGETKDEDEDEDEPEEVVVKGFRGNAVRTERGIQYLGKRLAKYILSITYPDQPHLPVKRTITQSISRTFTGTPKAGQQDGKQPVHKNSSIARYEDGDTYNLPYRIASISFVGHSLGGLVQTYAIAYIQKHSPEFFDKITPINFVTLASPFLGLSNENPMYVKFALDFGLVGRTGQDLGLTWRAPTIARSGWGAMVGGFSTEGTKKEQNPGSKPLLRILPTGPAHAALKRFRNRSVYSNVVNDGIVPLRTSCLLFLDWRGLGRVEKARRGNGIVGTMVNWGLNELTGQNASTPRRGLFEDLFSESGDEKAKASRRKSTDPGAAVPQAEASLGLDEEAASYETDGEPDVKQGQTLQKANSPAQNQSVNLWSTLTNLFRPQAGVQKPASPKQQRLFLRGQTMSHEDMQQELGKAADAEEQSGHASPSNHRKLLVRGSSLYTDHSDSESIDAPPRTTVFESAGDLLNPPLPPKEFLLDPKARPRTIFHDRVYLPEDIPPPPTKWQKTLMRSTTVSSSMFTVPNQDPEDLQKIASKNQPQATMRIEEKIARAYHKDMAWRKVLVRLEPDAHNNIIVRRMFANAYGWPVVKHMCDTHFGYTAAARTRDEDEEPVERARPQNAPAGEEGEEVVDQTQQPDQKRGLSDASAAATAEVLPERDDHVVDTLHARQRNLQISRNMARSKPRDAQTASELRESRDEVPDLVSMVSAQGEPNQNYTSMHSGTAALHRLSRQDSARWSDRFFDSSDDDEDDDEHELNAEWQRAYDRGAGHGNPAPPTKSTPSIQNLAPASHISHGRVLIPESGGTPELVEEPEDISRKNSDVRLSPEQVPDNDDGLSSHTADNIAEQVARIRSHSSGEGLPPGERPSLGIPKKSVD